MAEAVMGQDTVEDRPMVLDHLAQHVFGNPVQDYSDTGG
jgi:hypothetical protein